jgi:hypothetical protein
MTVALWQPEQVFLRIGLTFFSKPVASTAGFEGGAAIAVPNQSKANAPVAGRGLIRTVGKDGIGLLYSAFSTGVKLRLWLIIADFRTAFEAGSKCDNRTVKMADTEAQSLTEYSEDGVDLTLIRAMLAMSPAERLAMVQRQGNELIAFRELNAAK